MIITVTKGEDPLLREPLGQEVLMLGKRGCGPLRDVLILPRVEARVSAVLLCPLPPLFPLGLLRMGCAFGNVQVLPGVPG